jgi:hypothetical protein
MISCLGERIIPHSVSDTLTTFQKRLQEMGGPISRGRNCSPSQNPNVFRDRIRHSCDEAETSMREIN